jgi:hypothetical protein
MAHGTITRGVDGRKVEPTTTSIGIYTITPSIVSREFNGGWGGGGGFITEKKRKEKTGWSIIHC